MSRVAAFTVLALVGFAANSILCRLALGSGRIDAASFTGIRLLSGAVALALIARASGPPAREGSWRSAIALFAYAAAFSYAYLRLEAGAGALILFGSVQAAMIGWGRWRGERPGRWEWIGLVISLAGLIALASPGLSAPDPWGAALMVLAGVSWGVYSLRGRQSARPLAATAGNFLLSVPLAAALVVAAIGSLHLSLEGVLLACASGAIASGVGYSLWYAALPSLPATRAAVVQLAVPVLAAAAGIVILGETLSLRLVLSGSAILGGVAVAVRGRRS